MKYNRFINIPIFTVILFLVSCFTACEEEVEISPINEDDYIVSNGLLGYVTNQEGKRVVGHVEFRNEGSTFFYLNVSKKTSQDCTAALMYDETALEAYNIKNQTSYRPFPENLVTIENNGNLTVNAGSKKSEGIRISYRSDNTLDSGDTYVIPLSVRAKSGDMTISREEQTFLVFVKDL